MNRHARSLISCVVVILACSALGLYVAGSVRGASIEIKTPGGTGGGGSGTVTAVQGNNGINVNGVQGVDATVAVNITPTFATSAGNISATGSAGVADTFSRGDHTHEGVHSATAGNGIVVSSATGNVIFAASGNTTLTGTAGVAIDGTHKGTTANTPAHTIGLVVASPLSLDTTLGVSISYGNGLTVSGSALVANYGTSTAAVASAGGAGSSNLLSRADHVHAGVSILHGASGISLTGTTGEITITATGGSTGNVTIGALNGLQMDGTVNSTKSNSSIFTITPAYGTTLLPVAATPSAGSSNLIARIDHVHRGVLEAKGQNGITVNGTDNVSSSGTITVSPTYATTTANLGTGAGAGSADTISRGDHVHKATNFATSGGTPYPSTNVTFTSSSLAYGISSAGGLTQFNYDVQFPSNKIQPLGAAAADGSNAQPPHADHVHPGPLFGVTTGTTGTGLILVAGGGVSMGDVTAGTVHTISVTNSGVTGTQGQSGIFINGASGSVKTGSITVTPDWSILTDMHGVASSSATGSADRFSRADHVHTGVHSLQAGDGSIVITGGGAPYGDLTIVAAAGASGNVTLTPGTGMLVNGGSSPVYGNNFTLATTGGGTGNVTLTGAGGTTINGVTTAQTGTTFTITPTYGSVSSLGAADSNGSNSSASRSDHVHKGVKSIAGDTGISANASTGDVTLSVSVTGAQTPLTISTGNVSINYDPAILAISGGALSIKQPGVYGTVGGSTLIPVITTNTYGQVTDLSAVSFTSNVSITGSNGITVNGLTTKQQGNTFTITPTYGTDVTDIQGGTNNGSSNTFARSDHTHKGIFSVTGSTGLAITNPIDTSRITITANFGSPSGLGGSNSAGTSGLLARADHIHAGPYISVGGGAQTAAWGVDFQAGTGISLATSGASGGTNTVTITASGSTTGITLSPTPTMGSYTGTTMTLVATVNVTAGDACRMDSNGNATLAKGDAIANAGAWLMATSQINAGSSGLFLTNGTITCTTLSVTRGSKVYLNDLGTTTNTVTVTAPIASNSVTQVLGVATGANSVNFAPSQVMVEHQ